MLPFASIKTYSSGETEQWHNDAKRWFWHSWSERTHWSSSEALLAGYALFDTAQTSTLVAIVMRLQVQHRRLLRAYVHVRLPKGSVSLCNSPNFCSAAQMCNMDVPCHTLPCWAKDAVLCCAVLCCAVLCCAVLCCAASRLAQNDEICSCLLSHKMSALQLSWLLALKPSSQQWHSMDSCGPRSGKLGDLMHIEACFIRNQFGRQNLLS